MEIRIGVPLIRIGVPLIRIGVPLILIEGLPIQMNLILIRIRSIGVRFGWIRVCLQRSEFGS